LPDINDIRSFAENFFAEDVEIYRSVITQDKYAAQTETLTLIGTYKAYIGKVSGKDKELLDSVQLKSVAANANIGSQGTLNVTFAIVLLPHDTPLDFNYVIRHNNINWRVVWINTYTGDSVQVYEKAIIARDIVRSGKFHAEVE
jgi:hypothetical protein